MAAGVSRGAIATRLASGFLTAIYPGVYAVGHRSHGRTGELVAALLYAGEDGTFGHATAAEVLGIDKRRSRPITITLPRRIRPRPGLEFHHSKLPADEITVADDFPMTIVSRTLLDLAAELTDREVERALEECEREELGDAIGVEGILDRYAGHRGAGRLRRVWQRWQAGTSWTRSELEELFIEVLDSHDVPRGVANGWVQTETKGYECDHVWRRERLIVELDSREHHSDPAPIETDSAKRRALTRAGWRVVVVTWRQLRYEPEQVVADLRALLAEGVGRR